MQSNSGAAEQAGGDSNVSVTYCNPDDPIVRRALVRSIELVSGQPKLNRIYQRYRAEGSGGENFWADAIDKLCLTVRYDPEGRGKSMTPAFAGAPVDATPDPRYRIPYDNPVATPYPATVASPSAPKPESWQVAKPKPGNTRTSPAPKRRLQRSQDQFFKSRDRNKDGAITLEEYIGNPDGRNVPALTKRFKKIDTNSDGRLQLEELKKQTK